MHIFKTLAFLSLSTGALSWKVRAFSGKDCTGDAQEINVWDNTCRDKDVIKTRSFRVLAYGGHSQTAIFWKKSHCGDFDKSFSSFWADGGSDDFKKDKCTTLDYDSHAFGSQVSAG